MDCNSDGLNIIKSCEGCRLESYLDQGGVPTIGWGQTGPFVTIDMEITQNQADMWLSQQVQFVSAALSRMIKSSINNNQFSALVSLAYNIGTGNFSSSSALALINENMLSEVPHAISLWNKVNGAIDEGLVNRRNAEIGLFNKPVQDT